MSDGRKCDFDADQMGAVIKIFPYETATATSIVYRMSYREFTLPQYGILE